MQGAVVVAFVVFSNERLFPSFFGKLVDFAIPLRDF
jgi:hypothetical protein